MLAAVVGFQILIVVSLIFARVISGKHLLVATLAWSGFTLIAVFASWLLVLQLITIWATYAMLRRPKTGSKISSDKVLPVDGSRKTGNEQSFVAAPATETTAKKDERRQIASGQERGLLSALDRLNSYVDQQRRVQEATSALDIAVEADRNHINIALELARKQCERARRKRDDPEFAKFYEEAHGRLSALFDDNSEQKSPPARLIKAPDFQLSTDGEDPSVRRLIDDRVQELRRTREAFLDACLTELVRDPELKRYFWRATLAQEQPHLAEAFVKYAAARAKP